MGMTQGSNARGRMRPTLRRPDNGIWISFLGPKPPYITTKVACSLYKILRAQVLHACRHYFVKGRINTKLPLDADFQVIPEISLHSSLCFSLFTPPSSFQNILGTHPQSDDSLERAAEGQSFGTVSKTLHLKWLPYQPPRQLGLVRKK